MGTALCCYKISLVILGTLPFHFIESELEIIFKLLIPNDEFCRRKKSGQMYWEWCLCLRDAVGIAPSLGLSPRDTTMKPGDHLAFSAHSVAVPFSETWAPQNPDKYCLDLIVTFVPCLALPPKHWAQIQLWVAWDRAAHSVPQVRNRIRCTQHIDFLHDIFTSSENPELVWKH